VSDLDMGIMVSEKKLRLGHVLDEDAARLREIMNVEGISVEDMTRRVVRLYLSEKTARDRGVMVDGCFITVKNLQDTIKKAVEAAIVTPEKFLDAVRDDVIKIVDDRLEVPV